MEFCLERVGVDARFKDDEMSEKCTTAGMSKDSELYCCVSECLGSGRKVCRLLP